MTRDELEKIFFLIDSNSVGGSMDIAINKILALHQRDIMCFQNNSAPLVAIKDAAVAYIAHPAIHDRKPASLWLDLKNATEPYMPKPKLWEQIKELGDDGTGHTRMVSETDLDAIAEKVKKLEEVG